MKMITIQEFLQEDSPELHESFRIYQTNYRKVNELKFLRTLFSPVRFLGGVRPSLPSKKVVFDCSNQEKFKRMQPLMNSSKDFLVFISDLSTSRSKRFFASLDPSIETITFPSFYPGYWKLLPSIIWRAVKSKNLEPDLLVRVRFFIHLLQYLIHYEWIFSSSQAKYLITANEDTWFSPVTTRFCKAFGIKTINVMHGRLYDTRQFYDISVVYGKESEDAVKTLVSSETRVIRHAPAEIKIPAAPPGNYHLRKKLIFFDQPSFAHYSTESKMKMYGLLQELAMEQGFEIGVKLHPMQEQAPEGTSLKFYREVSNQQLLKEYGIAIAICSTVGLEVIASGVPILYWNKADVLQHFLQIKFLAKSAPKEISELRERVFQLQEQDEYIRTSRVQSNLLHAEYDVAEPVNPLEST